MHIYFFRIKINVNSLIDVCDCEVKDTKHLSKAIVHSDTVVSSNSGTIFANTCLTWETLQLETAKISFSSDRCDAKSLTSRHRSRQHDFTSLFPAHLAGCSRIYRSYPLDTCELCMQTRLWYLDYVPSGFQTRKCRVLSGGLTHRLGSDHIGYPTIQHPVPKVKSMRNTFQLIFE